MSHVENPKQKKPRKVEMTPRQAKFVETYMSTGSQRAAAKAAGYSCASTQAHRVANSKAVKAVVDHARATVKIAAAYNLERAMLEADEAITFAKETENANAYVKALELKSKLNGLLIEKHQHQHASFSLNIGGITEEKREQEVAAETVSTPSSDEEEDIFS